MMLEFFVGQMDLAAVMDLPRRPASLEGTKCRHENNHIGHKGLSGEISKRDLFHSVDIVITISCHN